MLTPFQIVTGPSDHPVLQRLRILFLKGSFSMSFCVKGFMGHWFGNQLSFLKLCGSQAKFTSSFKILKVLKLRNYGCLGVCDDCYRICCYFLLYFRIGGSTRNYRNQLWKTEEILKLQKCHHFKLHCAISLFPKTFNQCRKNLTGEAAKNHSQ